jgi:hypothetical protein
MILLRIWTILRRIKVVVSDEKTATNSSELVAIFWGTTSTVGGGGDIRLGIDFRFSIFDFSRLEIVLDLTCL